MAIICHPTGLPDQSGMAIDANGLQTNRQTAGRHEQPCRSGFPARRDQDAGGTGACRIDRQHAESGGRRPEEVDPAAPLYGEGLGLDSIDILEIALAISQAYGVQLRSDDQDNLKIFRSLRSLNEHIQKLRASRLNGSRLGLRMEVLARRRVHRLSVGAACRGGSRWGGAISHVLAYAPLVVLACWVLLRFRRKLAWLGALAAAAGVIYLMQRDPAGLAAAYGIPHAAINLLLLGLFASTLAKGREPLIIRLARRVHGTLTPLHEAYARKLTLAWCVYFAAQVLVSCLLFVVAPLWVWSLFVNLLESSACWRLRSWASTCFG